MMSDLRRRQIEALGDSGQPADVGRDRGPAPEARPAGGAPAGTHLVEGPGSEAGAPGRAPGGEGSAAPQAAQGRYAPWVMDARAASASVVSPIGSPAGEFRAVAVEFTAPPDGRPHTEDLAISLIGEGVRRRYLASPECAAVARREADLRDAEAAAAACRAAAAALEAGFSLAALPVADRPAALTSHRAKKAEADGRLAVAEEVLRAARLDRDAARRDAQALVIATARAERDAVGERLDLQVKLAGARLCQIASRELDDIHAARTAERYLDRVFGGMAEEKVADLVLGRPGETPAAPVEPPQGGGGAAGRRDDAPGFAADVGADRGNG